MVVVAIAVFLADVVFNVDIERFVAPDRIQITEIDLSQVRVAGDESVLYNTNVPDSQNDKETAEPAQKPKETEVAPVI